MKLTRRQAAGGLFATAGAGLAATPALCLPSTLADGFFPLQPPPARPLRDLPENDQPDRGHIDGARDRFDHLTAPVSLNGHGPFPFIVDTGASISCISDKLVETLGLPMQAARPVHTIVGVRPQPLAVVEELLIGPRRRRRSSALSIPLDQPGVEGVLGVDWLKGQRLTLNFVAERLEFDRSREEASAPGVVVVPARRRLGQLTIVDADLGDRRISVMIDSGSELSLCNGHLLRMLDRKAARPPERQRIHMVTIIGEPFSGELVALPFLRLGGLQLGNVPVVHADTHVFRIWGLDDKPALLLGMDLLREFRAVSLDFGRSQVRFDLPA